MERGIVCLCQYCREVCSAVCPTAPCYPAWQTYSSALQPLCYESVFLSSSSWHVQQGCCTPTPQPDMQPGHCRSTHPRLAAREHSHLLSLDFPGVIMLSRGQNNGLLIWGEERKVILKAMFLSFWSQKSFTRVLICIFSSLLISVSTSFNPTTSFRYNSSSPEICFHLLLCFLLNNVSWPLLLMSFS